MRLLLLVTSLASLCYVTEGQCCGPYVNYETYIELYMGMADENAAADPDAYFARARRRYLGSQKLEITEYYDYNSIPDFVNVRAIVGDYRSSTARIYTLYADNTCSYADYPNTYQTPPCVPPQWPLKSTFRMGSEVFQRYGDQLNNNYVIVQKSTCMPIMQLATRKNAPRNGIFRFNTEFYTNTTEYFGTIPFPQQCMVAVQATTSGVTTGLGGGGPGEKTTLGFGIPTTKPGGTIPPQGGPVGPTPPRPPGPPGPGAPSTPPYSAQTTQPPFGPAVTTRSAGATTKKAGSGPEPPFVGPGDPGFDYSGDDYEFVTPRT